MTKKRITKFPFEIARDIAYFELFKVYTVMNARAEAGEHISREEKMGPMNDYSDRTDYIFKNGLDVSELKDIIEDIKVNPIALKSFMSQEKRDYMIEELELLVNDEDSYNLDNFIYRLISFYGYNEYQYDEIIEAGRNNNCGSISLFDRVNDICQKLKGISV